MDALSSLMRPTLTEIYLCPACFCPVNIEDMETPGQVGTRVQRLVAAESSEARFNFNAWTCAGCDADYRLDVLEGEARSDDPGGGGLYGPPPAAATTLAA
jgi:hypothetical protein